ncbi:MAG: HNH endonuclease [Christensenellales bacterium]|jgi:5-methylcytosine-specific restriction protein A
MSRFVTFTVGGIYTNEDITEMFKCGNTGGMRRSHATNSLVIVSDHTKDLYDDKWIDNILHYTGMGKKGDQTLSRQNKTLAESNETDIEVHLFEVLAPKEYIYRGEVYLASEPYREIQKDEDGNKRSVLMFPLALIKEDTLIEATLIKKLLEGKEHRARRSSDNKVRLRAIENQSDIVSRREVFSTIYLRDVYVSEYAKRRANGYCQLCEQAAPFLNNDGRPYLETYHINWISQGGSDTIDNTVALCPNCHRKMHILNDEKDKQYLLNKIRNETND